MTSRETQVVVTQAFAVSIAMAIVMVLMALGFMSVVPHFVRGEDLSQWLIVPLSIALFVFALSFVAAAVLLDRVGTGRIQSLVVGAVVSLAITVLILAVYAGAKYINDGAMASDNETLLAGFALALIGSVIIDRLILS
jgi:hypothetical protein